MLHLDLLSQVDPENLFGHPLRRKKERQRTKLEMIASENFTSPAVMAATGSVLTKQVRRRLSGPPVLWRLR